MDGLSEGVSLGMDTGKGCMLLKLGRGGSRESMLTLHILVENRDRLILTIP